jgi:hypothetical protein
MKTIAVLAVSIVLVSILFCPMAMAAPPMPDDLQMVQPDPSLPKELAGFWGKWDGTFNSAPQIFIIVEKIDEEKASVYLWLGGSLPEGTLPGWKRRGEAKVIKEYGKYKLWFRGGAGSNEFTLKGEYLSVKLPNGLVRLRRVP